jgi:putative ABC transport system permease protein
MRLWGIRSSRSTRTDASTAATGQAAEPQRRRGMRLSGIRYIYSARLESRSALAGEAFAIGGLAVGVALLFASQISSTSLTHSVQDLNRQIVGNTRQLQLDARGPGGFDERLLGEVSRIPGVTAALPVLEQTANVVGPQGQRSVDIIATDPRLAHANGYLLRRFSARLLAKQTAIALPSPVAASIGARSLTPVNLQISGRTVTTLLAVALGSQDLGGLVNSPVALVPIAYAQKLTGLSGKITRIFVKPAPGREPQVHAALARLAAIHNLNLEPGEFDSTLFGVAVDPEHKSEALFSAIAALVGFMFAVNAMLLTIPARQELFEGLRSQGATTRQVIVLLVVDALMIGLVACAVGIALGDLLSAVVFPSTPGYLSFAFPVGNDRVITRTTIGVAISAGLIAAVVGVLWPLRSLLRTESGPVSSTRNRAAEVRLIAGALCLVITTVVLISAPRAAVVGNITLVVALFCLTPMLFDRIIATFDWGQHLLHGKASDLAATRLQIRETRMTSLVIAATAALAVFGTVEFGGTEANLTAGLDASAHDIDTGADVWVTPEGSSNAFATTSFAGQDSNIFAGLPGVSTVGVYRGGFLNWNNRRLWVLGPPSSNAHPIPDSQLLSGDRTLAARRIRDGGWAALSQALAAEHDIHVGQAFTLPSPHPITMRAAALITNLGWPPGALILSSSDYARAWGSLDPSAYQITVTPGSSPAQVRNEIRGVLGPSSAFVVKTAAERQQHHFDLAAQGLARLTQIRLLVLIAAVLAVAGTMIATLWRQRENVANLKCNGLGRGHLWCALVWESSVLLAAGCSVGAVFGLYAQLLGSHFLSVVTGFPIVFALEGKAAISSFLLMNLIAVSVLAVVAGYFVVRVPPDSATPGY